MMIGQNVIRIKNPLQVWRVPTTITWGLTNRTEDGCYLLFLDYDQVEYEVVRQDVQWLQKHFKLGPALTRTSSLSGYKDKEVGNYHVFFFTRWLFPEIRDMLKYARCDDAFRFCWKYNQQRVWVLRVGEKTDKDGAVKKPLTLFKEFIPSSTRRTCNRALVEFFETLDNRKLKGHFTKLDNTKDTVIIRYTATVHA